MFLYRHFLFQVRKESDSGDFRISRPISDYSGSEFEQQLNVKKRDVKPMRHMQVCDTCLNTSIAFHNEFLKEDEMFFLHIIKFNIAQFLGYYTIGKFPQCECNFLHFSKDL